METIKTPATEAKKDLRRALGRLTARSKAIGKLADDLIRDEVNQMYDNRDLNESPADFRNRIRALQRAAWRTASAQVPPAHNAEQTIEYARAKNLRGLFGIWENYGRDQLDEQAAASVKAVQKSLEVHKEALAWLNGCVPSVAEYSGVEGKTEFTDKDVVRRGNVSSPMANQYNILMFSFNTFLSRWQATIEQYEDQLALHEADPWAEVITAGENLGLEHTFEGSDDGCIWFRDPESGQLYYTAIHWQVDRRTGGTGYSVLDTCEVRSERRMVPTWKQCPQVDLIHTALDWRGGSVSPIGREPAQRHGHWKDLRSWIKKSIEAGNQPPESFPREHLPS